MSLNARNVEYTGGPKAEPLDPGSYPVRLVQVLSIGLQPQNDYMGEKRPPAHMLRVTYEFLDEFLLDEDGNENKKKPRWLSEEFPLYNLESERAKSTKRYVALDPELEFDGDWSKLIGAPGILTIVKKKSNKGKIYNNIKDLATMRKKDAEKAPELVNEPKVFDIDEPDMEVFMSLPEWLRDKMTKDNLEFSGSALEKALENYEETSEDKVSKDTENTEEASEEDSEEGEDW